MKKIVNLFRNVIFSGLILYGYNLIAVNFNMIIPINIITMLFVTFLGAPAMFALVLFKILLL